jgi:hypothetical protein
MSDLIFPLILLLAAAAVYFLCGLLRQHAIRPGLLDIPNDRSSHPCREAVVWLTLSYFYLCCHCYNNN